jgi:hypothetical protein
VVQLGVVVGHLDSVAVAAYFTLMRRHSPTTLPSWLTFTR